MSDFVIGLYAASFVGMVLMYLFKSLENDMWTAITGSVTALLLVVLLVHGFVS